MPSNSRTAKTVPPIIAAAKACIADLKQLHRVALAEQASTSLNRGGAEPIATKRRAANR